jgi:hypothetical protein
MFKLSEFPLGNDQASLVRRGKVGSSNEHPGLPMTSISAGNFWQSWRNIPQLKRQWASG